MKKLLHLEIYENLLTTFMTEKNLKNLLYVKTGFPFSCGLRVKRKRKI